MLFMDPVKGLENAGKYRNAQLRSYIVAFDSVSNK